jgi:hypothetical protein
VVLHHCFHTHGYNVCRSLDHAEVDLVAKKIRRLGGSPIATSRGSNSWLGKRRSECVYGRFSSWRSQGRLGEHRDPNNARTKKFEKGVMGSNCLRRWRVKILDCIDTQLRVYPATCLKDVTV